MAQKIVMGVCSANILRSMMFEAIMNHYKYIEDINRFAVQSSGINAEEIKKGKVDTQKKILTLEASLHYDVAGKDKKDSEYLIKKFHNKKRFTKKDEASLKRIYGIARYRVVEKNNTYRDQALTEIGIPASFLTMPQKQYVNSKLYSIVIGMDKDVVEKIETLYPKRKYELLTYGQLVGTGDLKDSMKGELREARRIAEYFMDTREKALTEMLRKVHM